MKIHSVHAWHPWATIPSEIRFTLIDDAGRHHLAIRDQPVLYQIKPGHGNSALLEDAQTVRVWRMEVISQITGARATIHVPLLEGAIIYRVGVRTGMWADDPGNRRGEQAVSRRSQVRR